MDIPGRLLINSVTPLLLAITLTVVAQADEYRFAVLPPAHHLELNCGTNEFPPFGYLGKDGKVTGIEVQILQEIGRRLGIDIDIRILPWPRLLTKMQTRELDCMFAAFHTEERAEYMHFTQVPIHVSRLALYVHQDRLFSFVELEDLRGKRIGMIRDFKTAPALDKALATDTFAEVVPADGFRQLFNLLSAGRVDVVILNHHVGEDVLSRIDDHGIMELPYALSSNSAFITFSQKKGMETLIPKINYALFEIIADGTYARLFAEHRTRQDNRQ